MGELNRDSLDKSETEQRGSFIPPTASPHVPEPRDAFKMSEEEFAIEFRRRFPRVTE
jgi:hypothetical protein